MGVVTRGTTNQNRLRRCDRWLVRAAREALRRPDNAPLVVDLGFGAVATTTLEMRRRLRAVRTDLDVVGLEIEPDRVALARQHEEPGLRFLHGGFEIPVRGRASVVRAFNVLRQYDEQDVPQAWEMVRARLTPDGVFVDGTCDELGRLMTWVHLDAGGPVSLSFSWRLAGMERPGVVAERLPKALIHRNVPGERIHRFLESLDRAWATTSPFASYGARQHFLATVRTLRDEGWPVLGDERRWRLGELTVAWDAVAPG